MPLVPVLCSDCNIYTTMTRFIDYLTKIYWRYLCCSGKKKEAPVVCTLDKPRWRKQLEQNSKRRASKSKSLDTIII